MTSVGLVLSLQYAQTTSTPMAYDAKTQYREFVDGWVMIRPTLQVSFTQWEKSRLELIGQFSAGLGYLPAADVGIFELYVAPGLRGWPHRSFAVGGTLGANAMLGADFPISPRLEIQFLVLL